MLLLRVNHEDRCRELLHVTQTTEVALQLGQFTIEQKGFLLDHDVELARCLHALVLEHLGDALRHRFEVGEHATEPTLVDVGHADFLRVTLNWVLSLLLGADEQHAATVGDHVAYKRVGSLDAHERLVEIDDVDAVALTEDETLHLGVPTTSLVSEVDTGFQHLAHTDNGHDVLLGGC